MGTALHILGAAAMASAIYLHPFPWTTALVGAIGGYLREQQYLHGVNKALKTVNEIHDLHIHGVSSWTLNGSTHKWLEAMAWGVGAGLAHTALWWLV